MLMRRGALAAAAGCGVLLLVAPHAQTAIALLAVVALALLATAALLPRPPALVLTQHELTFIHPYGQLHLPWAAIQRLDQVRLGITNGYHPLPYIGFRLKEPGPLLDNLSLRLAARLLVEQRDLLFYAEQEGASDARLEWESDRLRLTDGQEYDGVIAMFGHRMARLRQHLGFDLFLPLASFDRTPEQLLQSLGQAHRQSNGLNT